MKNFDGGVDAALVTPDRDQEVHRDQHQFPDEVEQEQIERQEDAGDAGQHPQQIEMEEPDRPGSRSRTQHRDDAEEEGEHHQQQAQAVEGEMKADAELGNPRPIDLEPAMDRAAESRTCG